MVEFIQIITGIIPILFIGGQVFIVDIIGAHHIIHTIVILLITILLIIMAIIILFGMGITTIF